MDLAQIAQILPNGFHDAQVRKIALDYEAHEGVIDLDIWIGDPSANIQRDRDAYRRSELWLRGLVYAILEAPGPGSSIGGGEKLWIDGGQYAAGVEVQRPGVPLPTGAFAYWFYVHNWNSFMHFAAMDGQFRWKD
jgi:hypothetical protein